MGQHIFGEKTAGVTYKDRYAVYTILFDKETNRLAVVEAPNGAFFLPGGEIEPGEDHTQALARELLEEMGVKAENNRYLGEAADYFYSSHRDTYFHNPAYFYVAGGWEKISEPTEEGQTAHWHTPEEAIRLLKRESHQWAVQTWINEQINEKKK